MNFVRKYKGFTLIELVVAVGLLVVFFGGVYLVFNAGINSYKRSSNKAEGLMACYILYQKLVYDLKSAVWTNSNKIVISSENGGKNNAIEFQTFALATGVGKGSQLKKVKYLFDQETNRVYRNGKAIGISKFEKVDFTLEMASRSGDAKNPKGNNVHFRITTMGRQGFLEKNANTSSEQDLRKRTTILGTVGFPSKTQLEEFPWYVINRTSNLRPES